MKTTELTKVQLADLIDAVSYMKPTDWTKYKEDGNRSGDRITNEDGKRRQSELLRILYGVKSEKELENEKNLEQLKVDMNLITNKVL